MKPEAPLISAPHLMSINPRPAQVFVRGQGAWLWDAAGTRYLDWLQGWAVNSLGHCPPELTQALHNAPAIELATRLCELSGFAQAFFGSTGAEVNETAIKLARKWGRLHKGGAHEIITLDNAFHGRNLSTMAASGKPGWDALFAPAMQGFLKARLNDMGSVRAALSSRTVAIMLEPVQGEAGVWPATHGFLQALRQLCDQEGLLLIFDEVQTGCARLGTLFGFEHFGVTPDIMTLGKGLGGGVPIAAVLAQARACVFEHGDHGGTYAGNPLMCAAALAVLNTLSQATFLHNVRDMGQMLQQGLQQVSQRLGLGEVRGHGLLLALELGHDRASEVVRACHQLGLLVNAPRPSCLRLMPRLNSTPTEIEQGLERLAAGLTAQRVVNAQPPAM